MSKVKDSRKIYIVGGGSHYGNWMQGIAADKMKDADLVVFTGGEDVNPRLYGKQAHKTTHFTESRDTYEVAEYKKALDLHKPMIGICRGAQFLCVMAGGQLVQDQSDQGFVHEMNRFDGTVINVTSMHHQAQYPWGLPADQYKILGWTNGLSRYHRGETNEDELIIGKIDNNQEIEEVWYKNINALTMQHHPECMFGYYYTHHDAKDSIEACRRLLNKFLAKELE